MSQRRSLPVLQPGAPSASTSTDAASGEDGAINLPDVMQESLDWDGVDCVLADLDDFVTIRELIARGSNGKPESVSDLVEARNDFVAGRWHGLQITYEFADELWIDTLLREPGGARLLRMAADSHGRPMGE